MEEEIVEITLKDHFYQDSFNKVLTIIVSIVIAIVLLLGLVVYVYMQKPTPVHFVVGNEWRVQPDVPINSPYLSTADVVQWVSEVLPQAFHFDFVNYNNQLQDASRFFTDDGWKVFLNQLNIYANYNNVQSYKLFIAGTPAGAPYILNQGLLSGRYAWWVQLPMTITYKGLNPQPEKDITLQVLVVRVPTLNNLSGVGIENVIVAADAGT